MWAWLIALWAWLIALWEGLFDHMGGAYRIVGVVRAFKQSLDMGSVEVGVAYRVVGGAYGHVVGAYVVGVARAFKLYLEKGWGWRGWAWLVWAWHIALWAWSELSSSALRRADRKSVV